MTYEFKTEQRHDANVHIEYLEGPAAVDGLKKRYDTGATATAEIVACDYVMQMEMGLGAVDDLTLAPKGDTQIVTCAYEQNANTAYSASALRGKIGPLDMVTLEKTAARLALNIVAEKADIKGDVLKHGTTHFASKGQEHGYQFIIDKGEITQRPQVSPAVPKNLFLGDNLHVGNSRVEAIACGKDGVIFALGNKAVLVKVGLN